MSPLQVSHPKEDPDRLVIEWDNRRIRKQGCLSVVLPAFWCCWTGATLYATWLAATDDRPEWSIFDWISLLMIGVAYLGVIGIAFTWTLRYTTECIELGPDLFRHYYVRHPWYAPIRWPTSGISSVEIGHHINHIDEIEAVATLNVFADNKRDLIAYWADDDVKFKIFCVVRDHLNALGLPVECINTMDELP